MSSESKHFCPACAYALDFEPWLGNSASDEICPCCGIHFGYDDAAGGDRERRIQIYDRWCKAWLAEGTPWRGGSPPHGWEPAAQLERLGVRVAR